MSKTKTHSGGNFMKNLFRKSLFVVFFAALLLGSMVFVNAATDDEPEFMYLDGIDDDEPEFMYLGGIDDDEPEFMYLGGIDDDEPEFMYLSASCNNSDQLGVTFLV